MTATNPAGVDPEPIDSGYATSSRLLQWLSELGIDAPTHQHDPVFTVEESRHLRGLIPGCHCKSLFLRNKRKQMWLVVCEETMPIDLKALGDHLGAGRLSFCSAERLIEVLGVRPGSVTPFALINDREACVQVVLDEGMMGNELLNYHPLENDKTTTIRNTDLIKFIEACGHRPHITDLSAL